ncbi:hypothetical protein LCGC14_1540130 [marine sediment metagenome]|uniref:Uncharacterized protein n=1 Tax=marine sediment metagenome TaxID=412755 RepID=A0A0F9L9D5_9ZZZZ
MGISTSSICNAVRMDDGKPYKPSDFIPNYERETSKEASGADTNLAKARFSAWNSMHDVLEEKRGEKEECS